MQDVTNPTLLDQIQAHMIGAFTFDFGRYVIAAGALSILLWVAKEWAGNRRIQNRRAVQKDYIREFASSVRTTAVFGATTVSTLLMENAGLISFDLESFSWGVFALQLGAIIMAHDAYFYWMHRALHHKKLFRITHLHHHKSRTPTPWAAYSFSIWEGITESAFVPMFLFAASLMGVAYMPFAVFVFLAWMIVRNVMGHAGVELHPAGWVDTPALDWLTTTTHHDLHHSEGRYNFGLYFTFWDRVMGTEHPEYKARFREVAKPFILGTKFRPANKRRVAEVVAVSAMAIWATTVTLSGGLGVMGALT